MSKWLEKLDGTVQDVGRGLAQVADEAVRLAGEAGKVVGYGVGSLELKLARPRVAAGQDVTGIVRLALSQPIEARCVAVTLTATRERTTIERHDGRPTRVRRTETLFEQTCELAGPGTYRDELFSFAVPTPLRLEDRIEADGVVGDVLNLAHGLRSMTQSPVVWKLHGFLDLAWKRNVTATCDIVVDQPAM